MLLAFRSDELKSSTCEENSINLSEKLGQFLLRNIVRNSYGPAPCPSDEVIIRFKNIAVVIKASCSVCLANRLSENANHRLAINGCVAIGLVVIALVISLPLVMDLVERQFSFKTLRRSLEF